VQDDVPRAGADVPQARVVADREADGVARRHVRLLAPERDGTRDEALVVHVVDRHTGGALGGCGERDREEGERGEEEGERGEEEGRVHGERTGGVEELKCRWRLLDASLLVSVGGQAQHGQWSAGTANAQPVTPNNQITTCTTHA
jgi:hypothetical protein